MRTITKPKATKPAAPAITAPVTVSPISEQAASQRMHNVTTIYAGPSSPFRRHARKLSAVMLNKICDKSTTRDFFGLFHLKALYGAKPFAKLDYDSGCAGRAIGLGFLQYVPGTGTLSADAKSVHGFSAQFQLTAKALAHSFKH